MSQNTQSQRLIPAGLFCLAVLVYLNGLDNGFLVNWDDPLYVWENPDIMGFSWANLKNVFSTFYVGNYAPVQMLSYMLDYEIWGKQQVGFFLTNVLLHACNVLLFYFLLLKLKLERNWSLLVALLFAVHPVQVESVAWISQRKNVLAMTFFLPSLWCYLHFLSGTVFRKSFFILSLVLFVLALLTKSVVVILPVILVAYDVFLRQGDRSLHLVIIEKVPYLLAALAAAALALVSQRPEAGGGMVNELHGGSAISTFLTMLTVFKDYLVNIMWPTGLSAFYHVDIKKTVDMEVTISILLIGLLFFLTWLVKGRDQRYAAFGLAVFFAGLLPVSQIIPINTLMNDRYLYFPMLGFALWLIVSIKALSAKIEISGKAPIVFCSGLCLCLFIATWSRVGVWSDSVALWEDAVKKQPAADHAWKMLGNSYGKTGKIEEAVTAYKKTLQVNPGNIDALYDLGVLYDDNEDYDNAIDMYFRTLAVSPGHSRALYNLGLIYTIRQQSVVAKNILLRGLEVSPDSADILLLLAANSYFLKDFSSAAFYYEKVRGQHSSQGEIAGLQSLIALRMGDDAAREKFWREAVKAGSSPAGIYVEWARLDALGGNNRLALESLERALDEGFQDLDSIDKDPDFENLRDDAAFLELISGQTQ